MVDTSALAAENRAIDERRKSLEAAVSKARADSAALVEPVRARVLAARRQENGAVKPVVLKPMAEWGFDGSLKDSIGALELRATGTNLFRFALSRELGAADTLTIDSIVKKTEGDNFKLKFLIREIMRSDAFRKPR